jgi:hypothetical protein
MLNQVQPTDKSLSDQKAYQQALSDFGIEELLEKISHYSEADFEAGMMKLEGEELEILATVLIQHLSNSINGQLISGFLNAIRNVNSEFLPNSVNQEITLPSLDFPTKFPDVETPRYSEGKTVRWKFMSENPDWGIIIGRFYAYASHLSCWNWKYVVLLDKIPPVRLGVLQKRLGKKI